MRPEAEVRVAGERDEVPSLNLPGRESSGSRHRSGVVAEIALVLAVRGLPHDGFVLAELAGRFLPVTEDVVPPPRLDSVDWAVARARVSAVDRVQPLPVVR